MSKRASYRLLPALAALTTGPAAAACPFPAAIQVLGSGGPDTTDVRASAGYVLWVDHEARLLVDVGGGVFLRFGEAKAKFESLDAIAITHLHVDHVADLAATLKSGFFGERDRPLPIIGPSGNEAFPSMTEFMDSLFNPKSGSFRYLSGYLDGTGGLVKLQTTNVDVAEAKPQILFANERFKLTAVAVKHGLVPALGYLIEVGGKRIAMSGDQIGDNPAFAALIAKSDILIMDHAVPEAADAAGRNLHARPSEIASLASKADVKQLVLSHNMSRSLVHLDEDLAVIKAEYKGRVMVAADLMCVDF